MVTSLSLDVSDVPKDLFFDKVVWTTKDVCSVLNCSERHIRELVSSDRIPYVKVGRLVRFYRDDILGWLKQGGTR
jgi:excisionase family DNA binding protein